MLARCITCISFALGLPLIAQTATMPISSAPHFEVSTVKRNPSGSGSSHSGFSDGLYSATNVQLKGVMEYSAYGIPRTRILGGPTWLDTERFDIEAKLDIATASQLKALSREERRDFQQAMFQQLLADRFKLAVHWETRTLPVYGLVPAKGGAKLHPSTGSEHGVHSSGTDKGNTLEVKGSTFDQFSQTLTQELASELGRVVLDKTGLSGEYDISLSWTSAEHADSPDAGPSIFTALQEQLGLRLEPTKGPVQVLVIDHIEMPAEN